MISMDKEYKTREGLEVRIYAIDGCGFYPVHGAIKNEYGWNSTYWRGNGMSLKDTPCSSDLIEVKPRIKIERWVLVNSNGDYSIWLDKPSKEVITPSAFGLTRISFEVEEGEGLPSSKDKK